MKAALLLLVLLAPVADAASIQFNPREPDTQTQIRFTTDAGMVTWDFGDGNKSLGREAHHGFPIAGIYRVSILRDGEVIAETEVPVRIPAHRYESNEPLHDEPEPTNTTPPVIVEPVPEGKGFSLAWLLLFVPPVLIFIVGAAVLRRRARPSPAAEGPVEADEVDEDASLLDDLEFELDRGFDEVPATMDAQEPMDDLDDDADGPDPPRDAPPDEGGLVDGDDPDDELLRALRDGT